MNALKIHCVLGDPTVKKHLEDVTELVGLQLQADGKVPSFQNVFNTLREVGVEADLQTIAHIYSYKFDLTDSQFTNQKKLDALSGKTLDRIIKKTHTLIRKKELGRDALAIDVANELTKLISPDVGSDPTVQRIIRDRLLKFAKRQAEIKGKKIEGKTTDEILKEALTIDSKQPLNSPFGPLGYLQTAKEAYEELQQVFKDVAETAGSPYQAANIKEYADKLAAAQYSLMLSHAETKKIIYDVFKEAGLTKELQTKTGPKTVIDWKAVNSSETGSEDMIRTVFSSKVDGSGNPLYTVSDIDRIVEAFQQEVKDVRTAKRQAALDAANDRAEKVKIPSSKTDLDRLMELYDLGIFGQARQAALLKVLGVTSSTLGNIKRIENILRLTNNATKTPITKWSRSFIKTLDREIEREIEEMEEGQSGKLMAVRRLLFLLQLNSALILTNIQNIIENFISALLEAGIAALSNPRAVVDAAKIFTNVLIDSGLGGVREGDELQNAFNTSAGLSERFSLQNAKSFEDKFWAGINALPTLLLSSTDNAFKSALIHLRVVRAAKNTLVKGGMTKEEANIVLNDVLHANGPEIMDHAKILTGALKAAGVRVTKATTNRIAAELSYGNLASGNVFKDITDQAILRGDLKPNPEGWGPIGEPFVRSIISAAASTAGKGLGHEADVWLLKGVNALNITASEEVKKARKKGGTDALVDAELQRAGLAAVTRFRGGNLRWLILGLQKVSGLLLAETVIEETIKTRWGKAFKGDFKEAKGWFRLNFDSVDTDSGDEIKMTESLSKYMSLRARLARQTLIPLLSYTVGYHVLLPALLAAFGTAAGAGDDDKEATAYAKLGRWIDEDPARKRWAQKMLPLAVYNYLTFQNKKVYGEVSEKKNTNPPRILDPFDPALNIGFLTSQYSPPTITTFEDRLQTQLNKDDPAGLYPTLGEFMGNLLNLGAPLKMYDINSNAIKALKGESTRLSPEQKRNIKPEDWVDGFIYSQVNVAFYEYLSGHEKGNVANIGDRVLQEYALTGDSDLLPPLVDAKLTSEEEDDKGKKIEYPFNGQAEKAEYVKFVEDYRKKYVDEQIGYFPDWDSMTKAEHIELLKEFYQEARSEANDEWLYTHPLPSGLK